jgi:hypothetical protein
MHSMQKHPLLIWLLTSPFVGAIHSPEWRETSLTLLGSGAPARTESFLRSRATKCQLDSQNSSSHSIQQLGNPENASSYAILGKCKGIPNSGLPLSSTSQHEPQTDRHTRVQGCGVGLGYQGEQDKQYQHDLYGYSSQHPKIVELVEVEEGTTVIKTSELNPGMPGIAMNQTKSEPAPKKKHSRQQNSCSYWQQTVSSCSSSSAKICNFNKRALAACQSTNSNTPSYSRRFQQNTGAPPKNRNVTVNIASGPGGMMAESTARLKFLTTYLFLWLSSFTLLQYLLGHGLAARTSEDIKGMSDGRE